VYQHLIREVAGTSTWVPPAVWEYAINQSQHFLYAKGGNVCGVQRRGQLMGSYLSFPFLNLANFLAFKWSVPRHVPLRINGDDIVFRSTEAEYKDWMRGIGASGLVLSRGKTMVHPKMFTLNSTLFSGGDRRVRIVPFLRAAALLNKPDSVSGLVGQYCSAAPGFVGRAAVPARVFFLRRHSKIVYSSQRSLRSMGMRVTRTVLQLAGLWHRERFYSGLDSPPLPSLGSVSMPSGSLRVACHTLKPSFRRRCREWEKRVFYPSVLALARIDYRVRSPQPEDYWTRVKRGTVRWVRPKPHIRRQLASWCRLLRSVGRPIQDCPVVRQTVWVPGERTVGRCGLGDPGYVVNLDPVVWGAS